MDVTIILYFYQLAYYIMKINSNWLAYYIITINSNCLIKHSIFFFSLSGIKPLPILDPSISMNQQMTMLKSNILAAQQYIQETGGDEKALNKYLQEKFKGTLSDSSTVDATSDSDNLTDSNYTDSEMETEVVPAKKQKQYDERLLRIPLERGK